MSDIRLKPALKPHTDTFFDMLGIEPEYIEDEDFTLDEDENTSEVTK